MEAEVLVSALSLFAGISLMPAAFLILRDREVPLSPNHSIKGAMATALALVLLCLGALFLLNTVAQDGPFFLALVALLALLPLAIIRIDKWRGARKN